MCHWRCVQSLGRFRDALDALENIRAPRVREQAYQVAASQALGDTELVAKSVDALRRSKRDFDPDRFVEGLPYEDDADRQSLLDALSAALG